ncbi:unnamed protein product [Oikopleura dioica]|uniref:glutamine--tRNA ligase n=2 Tax=Oikopleura dioica TaxID=34765 RepID=E4YSY9_OIKDI|nr:unnamed protein product [Oikopleura dioica]
MEELFLRAGLPADKVKQTLKNETLAQQLAESLNSLKTDITKENGMQVYTLVTKSKKKDHINEILPYIAKNQLDTPAKLDAAILYAANSKFDSSIFEKECGVGVVISGEDIANALKAVIQDNQEQLVKQRYKFNVGILLGKARILVPFADGKKLKGELDAQIFELLGPKTDADLAKPTKTKSKKTTKEAKDAAPKEAKTIESFQNVIKGAASQFHKVGENYNTDRYVTTPTTMQHMENHLKITGGQVRTRFPPEPNGILHIGHAKAINFNFGYAKAMDGVCYLRYDDTNPEKEEEKFFTAIKDMVEWLGYTPWKITHASDNFQQLYELAIKLIKEDLAYICHMTADELKGIDSPHSPWRERPMEESLALFRDMKNGKIEEGKATLRMKHVMEDGKKDPVAYRVKFTPHHRTGEEWCIYPTYDFTHCLCDSIEHISHSLCTKEFQARRSSYFWLCNAVDVYCPVQWEYGRLNIDYTICSKRKIQALIDSGLVCDWDDPRLFTLTALRRRGFPPQAINNFCGLVGVTGADCTLEPAMLEHCVRDELNRTALRRIAVMDPLKIKITNYNDLKISNTCEVQNVPNETAVAMGINLTRHLNISDTIYIERDDFAEVPPKGFRRLTPEQSVGLKYGELVVTVSKIIKAKNGDIECVEVKAQKSTEAEKPKAFIHWLDVKRSHDAEARLYSQLFKEKDPTSVPGGYIAAANKSSLEVKKIKVESCLTGKQVKVFDKFQFERVGYFCYDRDSAPNFPVYNLTIGLKEDKGK